MNNETTPRNAKCGHQDLLGYFANTYCRKCADAGHRKVTGSTTTPRQRNKKVK
jgi:hypothetical protein